jgi:uncharacterized protein YdaU (DUF1376 family)
VTKQDIWMPLYIADYLADTTRLNTEQHGAYLLIIMDYWRNGAPPDDDEVLANITRLTIQQWRKHKATLTRLFVLNDGFWTHKRIEEELLKASDNAEKFAERAKKAAAKRWNKESNKDATSNATSIPQEVHGDMLADATSPSPSPSSIKTIELTHTVEAGKSNAPTLAGSVCASLVQLYKANGKLLKGVSQTDQDFLACLAAGATVQEFLDAGQKALDAGKEFRYIVGIVVKQRERAAKLELHKGPLPATASAYQQGVTAAAKSIFKPAHTRHLQGVNVIDVGGSHEPKQIN